MPDVFEIGDAPASSAGAQVLQVDQVLRGTLSTTTDVDYYNINLVAGQTYTIAVVGTGLNGVVDPIFEMRDQFGTLIGDFDDGLPNANSLTTYTALSTGTYSVGIRAFDSLSSGQYGLSYTAQNKAVFDADMAAGVMNSASTWAAGQGLPATVSFGFRSTGASYVVEGSNVATFTALTGVEQTAVRQILSMISQVCGVTFTDANPNGFTNNAAMLFGNYNDPSDGAGAFAYSPGSTDPTNQDGDVWLNTDSISTTAIPFGSYDYATIIHEIGHALGLSHPGVYNAAPGVSITYPVNAQFFQDSEQYTVMSYFDAIETGAVVPGHPVTLMLSDIEVLQNIYGANMATRSGDTVYGFNSNAGGIYNFTTNGNSALCIWDGGGTDTLDFSGFAQNQQISLVSGAFSNVGGMTASFSIAMGANIENAVGGSGSDDITGNALANRLSGGNGADTLKGDLGADILAGGAGGDVLDGGEGTDAADYRQSTGTSINVSLLAGTASGGHAAGDTLISIEDLYGSLTLRDILIGNDGANALYGNGGDDSLRGEGGDDYLVGGLGADAINAGAGVNDWASYITNVVGQISVNLLTNINTGGDAQGDTLFFVENLEGALGIRSILIGNDLANKIVGHNGVDSIRGEGGNDTIEGGAGGDSLSAGAGIDTVTYANSTAGVTVDLKSILQVSAGEASGDNLFFFENVTGSDQADTLTGNLVANTLVGGLGADTIDGGTGSDVLRGGGGADTFRFQDLGFGSDRIMDWEDGVDKISISLPLETSFAGLTFTNNGTASVIVRGFSTSGTIVVQSAGAFTLDASDFMFV
jgi:serralysin